MAKIENKIWEGPMPSDEKNRIVVQGEKRLGLQNFIGFGTEELHKKMVHKTNITIIEEVEEETPSFSSDVLFEEVLTTLARKKFE